MRIPSSYRPDIDGLRALAVLLVIGFHAGVPWLSGGFVGVDVFFVISGYLITGILVDEHRKSGQLSLTGFWARRVARLAPALLLVVFVVLLLAPVFLSRIGGETGPAAKAAMATLLLNANHYFLVASGDYFANAAETNPFLHMWSLSVEEQFYLIWPLMLVALLRLGSRNALVLAMSGLLLASLGVSWMASFAEAPVGFYTMPTRAWELLAGAVLAVRVRNRPPIGGRSWASPLGVAGVVMIMAAALSTPIAASFPFPWALLPVAGATLFILAGAVDPRNVITRAFSARIAVYVGLISYPLYLWHWPLLVLTRADRLYVTSPWMDLFVVAASSGLAVITYELVERRGRPWFARNRPLVTFMKGASITVCLMAASLLLGAWARFGWAYNDRDRFLADVRMDFQNTGCMRSVPGSASFDRCYPRDRGSSVLLWGDSHATHWAAALKPEVEKLGSDLGIVALAACKPLLGASNRCDGMNRLVADQLPVFRDERGLRGVILSSHWSFAMGTPSPSFVERGPANSRDFYDDRARSSQQAHELFEADLTRIVAAATAARLRVLIILPSPIQRFKAPHCLSKLPDSECFVSREELANYSGEVERRIRRVVAGNPDVRIIDPKDFLCQDGRCPAVIDGVIGYSDDSHLTVTLAARLGFHFADDLGWLLAGTASETTGEASGDVPN